MDMEVDGPYLDLETMKRTQAISSNEGNRHKEKRVIEQVLLPQGGSQGLEG